MGATGTKYWGTPKATKQEVELTIGKHLGELYDVEEVPTSVDAITGKVDDEGEGIPLRVYL